ncbi:MAG: hypothetical protein FJ304_26390 [Planctomycetes bacterium]|nr:hypothetical protein [Planctomycetota bacterium]
MSTESLPTTWTNWFDAVHSLWWSIHTHLNRSKPPSPPADLRDLQQQLSACESTASTVGDTAARLLVSQTLYRLNQDAVSLATRLLNSPPYASWHEWNSANVCGVPHDWAGLWSEANEIDNRLHERDRKMARLVVLEMTEAIVLHPSPGGTKGKDAPVWDAARRTLTARGKTKRYRQRATRQEPILAAFQEEGWPTRIDTPLPSKDTTNKAVANLNNGVRQAKVPIIFEMDGTGEGILWKWHAEQRD